VLSIRSVCAGYSSTDVLHDVELHVPASSVVALLGPNGAGKTTLLKSASGLLPVRSGRLEFDGQDVTRWSTDRLARAGLCHVPEGRGVFRQLTVRENLLLQVGRGDDGRIDQALAAFPRLRDRIGQTVGTMSGGEQQMVALARAYITTPSVMLLDEVSMGLAPTVVDEIFAFLHQIREQGVALLLVEQYVTRALALADFVYVLDRGVVVFAGESSELDEERLFAHYLAHDLADPLV
jgi:branched-chain amino acid transport system ATP-binding protein